MKPSPNSTPFAALHAAFPGVLQENARLANYTTVRVGGPADALLVATSASELENAAMHLWKMGLDFYVLGLGSNVVISDSGLRGVVVINRARSIVIDADSEPPMVWAESGALIGTVSRQVGLRGLGGFEWASTVPGTLGGAVYGNAGAFGGDMQHNLVLAEILHPQGKELYPVERMDYQYRSSVLKRENQPAVILAARLRLERSDPDKVQEKMETFSAQRRRSQPPGASMGSMFKNPPGDFAGRLIEAAGLKGRRVGDAEISSVHANFFINHGQASAADIVELIHIAHDTVADKFGTDLKLEVELLGNWSTGQNQAGSEGTGA